ncbi:hypothetical protein [Isoptericola sp. QY 916]|uniref:hypothetical protein n=1 Tax=Isoptericola sp. QY 916 TaxID=2782570 RepID=UPI003D2FB70E|nr:hypothetical protein [Isoptericola sp. QY 916]
MNFGAGVPWRGVSAVADEKLANNVEASMDVRIVAFARARLEFSGHAHFGRSELREVLAYVVKSGPGAGEIRKPTRHGVTKAIQRLTDWGVFSPGSWSECIVFPGMSVQNGSKAQGEKPCPGRQPGS